MAEVLSAAEYRALAGSKPSKATAAAPAARSADRPPKSPPAPVALLTGQEKPKGEILALPPPAYGSAEAGQATWLFDGGRISFSLATPLEGRQRISCNGPHNPALLAALLATVEAYTPNP